MALVTSFLVLLAVGLWAWIASALGHRLLRLLSVELSSSAEHLLLSAALGFICIEVFLFFAQIFTHIRVCVFVVLALAVLLGGGDFLLVKKRASGVLKRAIWAPRSEAILSAFVSAVLLLQGLAATAPVTGSDALHYHFTAPLLTLRVGFHPNFFLSHSFFCGQSHLLILAGLALGSSRMASGLLFLGGVFGALASFCLARQCVDRCWSWIVALVFLVTPVVFWQMSISGAPDLWMAFFAALGVIVMPRLRNLPRSTLAILPGALAGAVAGTKYTGCIVALSLAIAYFWTARSIVRSLFFVLGAVLAGVWPYLRNLAWTGDPVFPFLTSHLFPGRVNAFALASYRADTGAEGFRGVWYTVKSIFFVGIDFAHPGFWQYFGPVVVAFAPALLLVPRATARWRDTLPVWMLSAAGISAISGMTRFLLPVFPIAIATVLAGIPQLRLRLARYVSVSTVFFFVFTGTTGLLIYDRSALAVAVGLTSPETYLRKYSPEYEKVQFVNRVLSGRESEGFALVFLRHTYYLTIPFIYGDPSASWGIDPAKLQTADDWRAFLRAQRIRWVVCSPDYPPAISGPLRRLQAGGQLVPSARAEITDFQGLRITENRQLMPVLILEVRN
jgi:uncharacterized protein DUF1420